MHALTIDRAALRYRVPASRPELRARLDRVQAELFDHALEHALAHAGLLAHELLCIRRVHVALRLPEQLADQALLDRWASALTRSLIEQIDRRDPAEVLRYGTPLAALLDMARSLARDDRRRAWAWASLGLIASESIASSSASVRSEAWVRALLDRPEAIVAVWAGLARTPALARRWIAWLPGSAWVELGDAALRVHGVPATTRAALRRVLVEPALAAEHGASQPLAPAGVASASFERADAVAGRPSQRSAILELIPEAAASPSARLVARALAIFALLDAAPLAAIRIFAEPEQGHAPEPAVLLGRMALRLGVDLGSGRSAEPPHAEPPAQADSKPESARELEARLDPTAKSSEPSAEPTREVARTEVERTLPWRDEPLDARARATTSWAGLLFVLAILRRDQLWPEFDALAEAEGVELRPLLHAFARTLLPAEVPADDPALLAFVGLPPDAMKFEPLELEPLRERLAPFEERTIAALERCLPARDDRPSHGRPLLAWLLRRHGEVLAEPGWLELRLWLREVDTDIRRAGLDLDPDWLPELGVVVKFIYV